MVLDEVTRYHAGLLSISKLGTGQPVGNEIALLVAAVTSLINR